jgi:hypothetical protein
VRYLKGARGCTVHHVRAPTREVAAAMDWLAWAVPLRLREAVPRLGHTRVLFSSEGGSEAAR